MSAKESTAFTTHRIISPVFPEMTEALCECGNVATTTQTFHLGSDKVPTELTPTGLRYWR